MDSADIIIMYFAPASQSPITLLELGLYASSGKLMVVCADGFWRKGNVILVTEKYNIPVFDNMDLLMDSLKRTIKKGNI